MNFAREAELNTYYNVGHFNAPERIGWVMNEIRKLKPLTVREWYEYYIRNIHDTKYIRELAQQFYDSIPQDAGFTYDDCLHYMCNVMFARTFAGYDKERKALGLLRKYVSPAVQESPKEWDNEYFIDFYICCANQHLIGIQLKPETFYKGNYQNAVHIEQKMNTFKQAFQADIFVLTYKSDGEKFEIVNIDDVRAIQKTVKANDAGIE